MIIYSQAQIKLYTGQTFLKVDAQYTYTRTQTDLWLSPTHIIQSHIWFKCTDAFSENRWRFVMQLQDQPNVCLSLVKTERRDRPPLPLISNPAGPSSTRLDSLSQQRTTLLFPLYSSSQPCDWGLLTQCSLWLWWIAALKTTTKAGFCWSVWRYMGDRQTGLSESVWWKTVNELYCVLWDNNNNNPLNLFYLYSTFHIRIAAHSAFQERY